MSFINEDFMLTNATARELYHESAEKMPIIDYHCHLVPQMIAENYQFKDLTEVWLGGDHYKWRAMRGNGVPEEYITGSRSSYEKFEKWAATMPYAMRNPLYHWTHLELARVFGVDKVLKPETAREIYDECTEKLQSPEFRGQELIKKFNAEGIADETLLKKNLKQSQMNMAFEESREKYKDKVMTKAEPKIEKNIEHYHEKQEAKNRKKLEKEAKKGKEK